MDGCPEEHSVNWLDRETQKRLCRQSQELLQRAQTRAVNWSSLVEDLRRFHNHAPEKAALNHVCRYHRNQLNPTPSSWVRQKKPTSHDPRESYQVTKTGPGPSKVDPGPSKLDPGPSRLDPGPSRLDPGPSRFGPGSSKFDTGPYKFGPRPSRFVARTHSKDITIEVSPGTYTVTVGSPNVTTTRMIEVDSGQIIDLSFPL